MTLTPQDVLQLWGRNVSLGPRLGGGHRNDVWAVTIDGKRCTLRRSRRTPEAFAWELDLIEFLASRNVGVPAIQRTLDGERMSQGFVVLSWIEGRAPESADHWREVARQLRRIHDLTRAWPQRPTFASTVDLLRQHAGADVDLRLMPRDAVVLCRRAWSALIDASVSVIHGDPLGNVLITSTGVVFIDWDESRVDASLLDLADLVGDHLAPADLAIARPAASAWEAANAWVIEPDYARYRLAELS